MRRPRDVCGRQRAQDVLRCAPSMEGNARRRRPSALDVYQPGYQTTCAAKSHLGQSYLVENRSSRGDSLLWVALCTAHRKCCTLCAFCISILSVIYFRFSQMRTSPVRIWPGITVCSGKFRARLHSFPGWNRLMVTPISFCYFVRSCN